MENARKQIGQFTNTSTDHLVTVGADGEAAGQANDGAKNEGNDSVAIVERRRTETLVSGQKQVLEMLATGAPLSDVLAALIRVVEVHSDGMSALLLLRRPDSDRFSIGVAPSLPQHYTAAMEQVGATPPFFSPCCMTANEGKVVVVDDIRADDRWSVEWRNLALGCGLRTCHASPVVASDGTVIGSFGMYYRDLRNPIPPNRPLLEGAIHLASIAIEARQREEALRESDRRKDEFLAMLAHELRNPLAPIRNALKVMRMSPDSREAFQSNVDMMERQVEQMARLVEDLLDVNRISRGKISLRKGRVDLGPIVRDAVEAVRHLYENKRIDLVVELPDTRLLLDADAARLGQIVGNLLHNACKFTGEGGRVWLRVKEDGEYAEIRVRDTGIGIKADQVGRVFDMFTQVGVQPSQSRSGLGIGLTLVKDLVDMHGGSVQVDSAGIGRGSEFVVRIPVPAQRVRQGERSAPPPREDERMSAPRRRILIVDDYRDSADSLAELLRLMEHDAHTAYDGPAAIAAAERFRPDIVLLDIGLPTLDGYETARRIRNADWGDAIVLVALTGWGRETERRKSEEAGFDAHLVKPINLGALEKLLATAGRPDGVTDDE